MSDVIGKGEYRDKTLMTKEWLDYMKETEKFYDIAYKPKETAKYYTIGYGFDYLREGSSFDEWVKNLKNERRVEESDTITREIANEYMLFLIEHIYYDGIADNFGNIIGDLNKYQLSSLIDIAYNCGRGALINSDIMKLVKENPNDPQIGVEIEKFQISSKFPGLAVRRKICAEYYFNGKLNKNAVPTVKYQTDSITEVKYSSTNDCNTNNCIIDDNGGDNDGDNSNNVNQESYDYYVGLQKQANEDGRPCNIRMINELHKLDYIKFGGFRQINSNSNIFTFIINTINYKDNSPALNYSIGQVYISLDEDDYKSSNIKVQPYPSKIVSLSGSKKNDENVKKLKEIFNKKYAYTNDLKSEDIEYFENNIMKECFKKYSKNKKYKDFKNQSKDDVCLWKKRLNNKEFDKLITLFDNNKWDFVTITQDCTLDKDDLNIGDSDILITRMVNDKGNNIFNVFKTTGDLDDWTSVNRLKRSSYRKG